MGNWHISIEGIGAHHNPDLEQDANRMAHRFVNALRQAGHQVRRATFTHGSADALGDGEHGNDGRSGYTQQVEAAHSETPATS